MTEKTKDRAFNAFLALIAILLLVFAAKTYADHETWLCENNKCETLGCEFACED